MLKVYRSNRAEWLAQLLSEKLRLEPPGIFEKVEIVVNTWPTSRWLGEQISITNGINALVRFPFPGTYLKQLVKIILNEDLDIEDPWKGNRLVWEVIDLLPNLLETDQGRSLREWSKQQTYKEGLLNRSKWQLANSIANLFDDYVLYRPELLMNWSRHNKNPKPRNLTSSFLWQPVLYQMLEEKIETDPFGVKVKKAIQKLKEGKVPHAKLPKNIRLFGISSLAPIQIELIQAISGYTNVEIYLLTPCPNLWQRHPIGSREFSQKLGVINDLRPEGLEKKFGRMASEFQQLLEGSGENQLGAYEEKDLFAAPISMATEKGRLPTLLEQQQQQLVIENEVQEIKTNSKDSSLLFMSCPGDIRQIQLIRDQILQWFAGDATLQPKDVLIMTPKINNYAPLISSVFNDTSATGIKIPWRITDRSQQESPGVIKGFIEILELAEGRLTATSLKSLISNPSILEKYRLTRIDVNELNNCLQKTGFRWGLDRKERKGDETHSLKWCLDRWLLGLVLPPTLGASADETAPFSEGVTINQLAKWWNLISNITKTIELLRINRYANEWIEVLQNLIEDLFDDSDSWAWEKQCLLTEIENWREVSTNCKLKIGASTVADILSREISLQTGRFGHRSGALTISELEPMRAIPHRVIVLMGLDAGLFPRYRERPGFDLLNQKWELGDPRSNDQDRYILLEALISARQHLLITWNSRNEKTGEVKPLSTPIQQWLKKLENELEPESFENIYKRPDPNPLSRKNFLSQNGCFPISCDRRNLEARKLIDKGISTKPIAIAIPLKWDSNFRIKSNQKISYEQLKNWLIAPQRIWLDTMQLRPREWVDRVEDLEALELNELQRQSLLREKLDQLTKNQSSIDESIEINEFNNDWEYLYQGRGILPPKSAAKLESERLNERWYGLFKSIKEIGSFNVKELLVENDMRKFIFAGDHMIIVQLGKYNAKGIMQGWLNHLYLCRNEEHTKTTILLSRSLSKNKSNDYTRSATWKPVDSNEAAKQIESLKSLTYQGTTTCWPIPPESGWALCRGKIDSTEKGEKLFRQTWEGNFKLKGEKAKPEMELCFGTNYDASEILSNQYFNEAYCSLYEPLSKALLR
ncbi:exodeoxyribonuclease V subunit gamma [Prochlorococcus sp. MIT 1300]|uniref:exodeoxyribonuclease V subunit gamma n=1 Tax=Prochlorococcus sp. MIT 1300 TaxID=3096218 RepID=UPI002A74B2E9|nr:exodeoxyribonuclease V subunit gamma [Prochlorococcus sp. MIT 1300]